MWKTIAQIALKIAIYAAGHPDEIKKIIAEVKK